MNLHLHEVVQWGQAQFLIGKAKFWNIRGLVTYIIDALATFVLIKYTLVPKIVRTWSDNTSVTVHRWTRFHKGTVRFIIFVFICLVMNALLKFASWQLTGIWN